MQQEFYPYNEPAAMPVEPVILPDRRLAAHRARTAGPHRAIARLAGHGRPREALSARQQRCAQQPADRGITAKLYGGGAEMRLMQEIVLGVGGWRVVEALHPEIEICHVNEGHAAFAIIERARHLALKANLDFWEALWATRAGNVFTTHTPVAAGFDQFPCRSAAQISALCRRRAGRGAGSSWTTCWRSAGSNPHDDPDEPFNMAFLAQRGSAMSIGVSRLHGEVQPADFPAAVSALADPARCR